MAQLFIEQRFERVRVLEETASDGGLRFEAVVSEADFINRNNRKYPFGVLWPAFQKLNENPAAHPGAVDHPDPYAPVSVTDLGIAWEHFWNEGNLIYGRGRTLNTAKGRDLRAVMEAGIPIGFSTRGRGTGDFETLDGRTVFVMQTFELESVDAVTDPSVDHARVKRVTKEGYAHMDADKLIEALEAKALQVARAEVKAELEAAQEAQRVAEAARAEVAAKLEEAQQRIAELEAQIAEAAAQDAKTQIEAKLVTLTADDRFGAAIRAQALKTPGITLENAEEIVASIRELLNNIAAAANEGFEAAPKGVLTSDEDAEPVVVSAEGEQAETTEQAEKDQALREMGLL